MHVSLQVDLSAKVQGVGTFFIHLDLCEMMHAGSFSFPSSLHFSITLMLGSRGFDAFSREHYHSCNYQTPFLHHNPFFTIVQ
jgi:hypothetical protein